MFSIAETDIFSQDAECLLQELGEKLFVITGNSGEGSFSKEEHQEHHDIFLIGYWDGVPISCGAIRMLSSKTAEIKRVYARENHCGAGFKIVQALEEKASERGADRILLETRKVNQHAVRFYQNHGYICCENYGKYIERKDAICFSKTISKKDEKT